jgi:hypothetical protein
MAFAIDDYVQVRENGAFWYGQIFKILSPSQYQIRVGGTSNLVDVEETNIAYHPAFQRFRKGALNRAIVRARLGVMKKQVWLVYQINDDDAAIGTFTSQGTTQGEAYEVFRDNLDAAVKKNFNRDVEALKANKSVAAKVLRKEMMELQQNAKMAVKENAVKTNLVLDLVFGTSNTKSAQPTNPKAWPSIFNGHKTKVETVKLYLNFSPCIQSSDEKTINGISYPQGCLFKLKALATQYNNIRWVVHYDELFEKPSAMACRNACLTVKADTPNMEFWARVIR